MKRFFACAVALVASASVSFAQCSTVQCLTSRPVANLVSAPVQKFQQAVQSVTYGVKARVRERAWLPRVRAYLTVGR